MTKSALCFRLREREALDIWDRHIHRFLTPTTIDLSLTTKSSTTDAAKICIFSSNFQTQNSSKSSYRTSETKRHPK